MKRVSDVIRFSLGLLLLAAAVLQLTGCATPDTDNASARPWNAPKNWEGGLPGSFYEQRR